MNNREKWLVAGLGVLLALFFCETWFSGRALFARDITYVFHPMHVFSAENLQAGRLPLWNPYVAGGVPWMGDPQTGIFYPGNIPFFLLPFAIGFKFHQALHFFLTALGAYLLVRSRGGSRAISFLAGALWSLNGFWVARAEFPSLLATISWLPFLILTGQASGRFKVLLPGVVFALSFFSGHTPHFLWTGVLWIAWVWADRGTRGLKFAVKAAALCGILVSVQLFNTAEAFWASERFREGLTLAEAAQYSLSPKHLLGLLVPYFSAMREFGFTGEKFFWLGSFHLGLGGAALALASWKATSRRHRWVWAGAALVGTMLCLGDNGLLFPLVHRLVPILRGIRYPGQYTFFILAAGLLLVVSAAREIKLSRRIIGWIIALCIAEAFVYGFRRFPTLPSDYFRLRPAWVKAVQASDQGRFFLSPKATSWTKGEGSDAAEQWTRLRFRLLNLGTAPYHLRGLNPFGFAFIPRGMARFLSLVYSSPSFSRAWTELTSFNVRWIAAPEAQFHPDLKKRAADIWHLYETPSWPPGYWQPGKATPKKSPFANPWIRDSDNPNRCYLLGPAAKGGTLRISEFAYPGWHASANGKKRAVAREAVFVSVSPEGESMVKFEYRPLPFRIGLVLTLGGLLVLGARLSRSLVSGPAPES